MTNKACISCRKAVDNDRAAATFACPSCGAEIVRCGVCRKASVRFKCSCNLEGP